MILIRSSLFPINSNSIGIPSLSTEFLPPDVRIVETYKANDRIQCSSNSQMHQITMKSTRFPTSDRIKWIHKHPPFTDTGVGNATNSKQIHLHLISRNLKCRASWPSVPFENRQNLLPWVGSSQNRKVGSDLRILSISGTWCFSTSEKLEQKFPDGYPKEAALQ